ncbi:MAG: hypothetical protein ACI89X_004472 [Planctomycetota bacterium]
MTASPPACDDPLSLTCPRSGKWIALDSKTRYRGHVVGFCTTHCRDDFQAHVAEPPDDTSFFNARIKALRELRFPQKQPD